MDGRPLTQGTKRTRSNGSEAPPPAHTAKPNSAQGRPRKRGRVTFGEEVQGQGADVEMRDADVDAAVLTEKELLASVTAVLVDSDEEAEANRALREEAEEDGDEEEEVRAVSAAGKASKSGAARRERQRKADTEALGSERLAEQGIDLESDVFEARSDGPGIISEEARRVFDQDDGEAIQSFEMDGFWNSRGEFVDEEQEDDDPWLAQVAASETQAADVAKTHAHASGKAPNQPRSGPDVASMDSLRLLRLLVSHMEPGETVKDTLRRLGKSVQRNKPGAGRQQGRRRKYGKKASASSSSSSTSSSTPAEAAQHARAFSMVTDAVTALVGRGELGMYSKSRARLERALEQATARAKEAAQRRRQAHAANASSAAAAAASAAAESSPSKPQFQWVYKWNMSDKEQHGPFTGEQMDAWRQAGYLDGVYVKRVGQFPTDWVQATATTSFQYKG